MLIDNATARSGYRLRDGTEPAEAAIPGTRRAAHLAAPLTERELEVVRLLPSHLTYDGMAETLFVSTNTIKACLKSIYRKLGAEKRSEAVDNGRALGLID